MRFRRSRASATSRGAPPPGPPEVFPPRGKGLVILLILAAQPASSAEIMEAAAALPEEAVAEFRVDEMRLALSAGDVTDATPHLQQNAPGLSFRLAPEAGRLFADLTSRSVGRSMSLDVCGTTLVKATILDRLEGTGHVAFYSLGEAVYYARRMTGEVPCD